MITTRNVSQFGNVMQVESVNFSAHVPEAEMEVVNLDVEGVQGQRVTPHQAGNYRSKTKDRFLPNFKF